MTFYTRHYYQTSIDCTKHYKRNWLVDGKCIHLFGNSCEATAMLWQMTPNQTRPFPQYVEMLIQNLQSNLVPKPLAHSYSNFTCAPLSVLCILNAEISQIVTALIWVLWIRTTVSIVCQDTCNPVSVFLGWLGKPSHIKNENSGLSASWGRSNKLLFSQYEKKKSLLFFLCVLFSTHLQSHSFLKLKTCDRALQTLHLLLFFICSAYTRVLDCGFVEGSTDSFHTNFPGT